MGKPTGFMEWPREKPPERARAERLQDSREFHLPLAEDDARKQAGRCMDCGVPFCQQGCPLGNPIPDFNDAVYRGRWEAAFHALSSTNNFPEFTGRLCPAPCESACVLAVNQDPVTIEEMEKEIIERAFAHGWVKPRLPRERTGKSVGVVGSGPAGLAAAAQLNQAGHAVTLYERADRVGGLLRYGIPDFKMEKWVIDRRVALLEAEGVTVRTGVDVGGSVSWAQLRGSHDGLVIATGARVARELDVPGRALAGVVQAMDFLEQQNQRVAGLSVAGAPIDASGKRVIILGGGDTGSDCLGTSLRQGALSVTQVELLPAAPRERVSANPWPQWPLVFRTSSSQEEGGAREFGWMTKRLEGEGGQLTRLAAVRVEPAVGPDGRMTLGEVAGSEVVHEVDLLILAMGFTGPQTEALTAQLGVALDARGNVQRDATYATSVPGVYCAGDAGRGASLIVWAISEGREAARALDAQLTGELTLPTRGRDSAFGGR